MATRHKHRPNRETAVLSGFPPSPFRVIVYAGIWSALAFTLNLVWEVAHVGFYTLWAKADLMTVARALIHCTFGDIAIALTAFALAGLSLRRMNWPENRPVTGTVIVIIIATTYTAWSEWYNVYQIGSWAYTADMPLIFGIGLSPLLQWLILPPLLTISYRLACRRLPGNNGTSITIPLQNISRIQK